MTVTTAVDVTVARSWARKRTPGVGWGVRAEPHVLGIVLAGGRASACTRSPLTRLNPRSRSGHLPAHRFRAVEPGQRRIRAHLRAHPIQVALAGPPHRTDLVVEWIPRRIHHVGARAARLGKRWFTGSADAIPQSLNLVYDEKPDYLVVFGADHVYRMDPSQMVAAIHRLGRGCNGGRDPRAARGRRRRWAASTPTSPGRIRGSWRSPPIRRPRRTTDDDAGGVDGQITCSPPTRSSRALREDSADEDSDHDMGGNIIPLLASKGEAAVYDFVTTRGSRRHRARPRLLA